MRIVRGVRHLLLVTLLLGCRCPKDTAPTDAAQFTNDPRVIVSGQDHPWNVSVDATHVYWTTQGDEAHPGSVFRVRKGTSTAEPIALYLPRPHGLALFANGVSWTEASATGRGIGSRIGDLSSATPDISYAKRTGTHEPWSLVVHNGIAYWTDPTSREVAAARIGPLGVDGADIRVLVKSTDRPYALAVDATGIYFTDVQRGAVIQAPLAGGAPKDLVADSAQPLAIVLDEQNVYWADAYLGLIGKIAKTGGDSYAQVAGDQKGAAAIAIDSERVYWTHLPTGSIRSAAKGGGEVRVHATGQKGPVALAVDATTIYWVNNGGDAVMAIEK